MRKRRGTNSTSPIDAKQKALMDELEELHRKKQQLEELIKEAPRIQE